MSQRIVMYKKCENKEELQKELSVKIPYYEHNDIFFYVEAPYDEPVMIDIDYGIETSLLSDSTINYILRQLFKNCMNFAAPDKDFYIHMSGYSLDDMDDYNDIVIPINDEFDISIIKDCINKCKDTINGEYVQLYIDDRDASKHQDVLDDICNIGDDEYSPDDKDYPYYLGYIDSCNYITIHIGSNWNNYLDKLTLDIPRIYYSRLYSDSDTKFVLMSPEKYKWCVSDKLGNPNYYSKFSNIPIIITETNGTYSPYMRLTTTVGRNKLSSKTLVESTNRFNHVFLNSIIATAKYNGSALYLNNYNIDDELKDVTTVDEFVKVVITNITNRYKGEIPDDIKLQYINEYGKFEVAAYIYPGTIVGLKSTAKMCMVVDISKLLTFRDSTKYKFNLLDYATKIKDPYNNI